MTDDRLHVRDRDRERLSHDPRRPHADRRDGGLSHYDLWREDFRLVQDELRIRFLRYGPPLHRVWRGPDRYDWSFVDEAFGELRRRDVCLQAPVALPSEHEESFVRRRMEAARRRFNLARQHGAELAEPRAENDWDRVEPGRGARA